MNYKTVLKISLVLIAYKRQEKLTKLCLSSFGTFLHVRSKHHPNTTTHSGVFNRGGGRFILEEAITYVYIYI